MKAAMDRMFRDLGPTTAGTFAAQDQATQASEDAFLRLWSCSGTSGACALSEDLPGRFLGLVGTTGGVQHLPDRKPFQSALSEIRTRAHLTWNELATIFGVNRRSLHFWARGARPSPENAERIASVLHVIRRFDAGDPDRTHAQLVLPRWEGGSIIQLLSQGQDARILKLASRSAPDVGAPRGKRPPPLSESERRRRAGLAPAALLESRHDNAPAIGKSLGAIPIPGLRV